MKRLIGYRVALLLLLAGKSFFLSEQLLSTVEALSPALVAANARLMALRAARLAEKEALGLPTATAVTPTLQPSAGEVLLGKVLPQLPAHLGWGSAALTAVYRARTTPPVEHQPILPVVAVPPTTTHTKSLQPVISLHPTLALALLKKNHVAAGRVWLILRALDTTGRGWHTPSEIHNQLSRPDSPTKLCAPRQLRHLLEQGEGLFWHKGNGRYWLRSCAKVALGLGVERFSGHGVHLPLAVLTQSIAKVRAHFYATFHSGRKEAPIARATLETLTSLTPPTQRAYEKAAGVHRQSHIALGPRLNTVCPQNLAWEHGKALFAFTDHNGRHGKAGQTYWAWQLPNSYHGPHLRQNRAATKRLNRQLQVLSLQGKTGNSLPNGRYGRRFFANGQTAVTHHSRTGELSYWQGKPGFWHPLGAGENLTPF